MEVASAGEEGKESTMSTFKSFRELSRVDYGEEDPSGTIVTLEKINCGSLQRIADGVELMAKSYRELIYERNRYEQWFREEREKRHCRDRSIAALRGVITKLKRAK